MHPYRRFRRSPNHAQLNRVIDVARFANEVAAQAVSARAGLRFLLVSDRAEYTSEMQYAPFATLRGELRRQLGVLSIHADWPTALRLLRLGACRFDVIGVKVGFRRPDSEVVPLLQQLVSAAGDAKLVYFDGDDDLNFQRPWILEHVHVAVKKHVYRDVEEYSVPRAGKSNLTDYVVRNHGISFEDDIIPRSSPVPPSQHQKLQLGWNIALDYKMTDLFENLRTPDFESRGNDVICRAPADPSWWIYPLRSSVKPALAELQGRYRIHTPSERVSQEAYYEEMRSSRICVSPFGYGEICWRDFEAVMLGCLLVKPDVGHLRTQPDVFVPFETYVPVAWDYSDLAEKCERYLRDDGERRRIAENAWNRLDSYYRENGFVDDVARLLRSLGLMSEPSPVAANS